MVKIDIKYNKDKSRFHIRLLDEENAIESLPFYVTEELLEKADKDVTIQVITHHLNSLLKEYCSIMNKRQWTKKI